MNPDLSLALTYAQGLISRREYSCHEIAKKLQSKFSAEISTSVVQTLQQQGLLDDERFAAAWTRYQKQRHKGPLLIQSTLQQQHIAPEIIERVLVLEYSAPEQAAVRQQLAEKQMKKIEKKHPTWNPHQKHQALQRYLYQRGFLG